MGATSTLGYMGTNLARHILNKLAFERRQSQEKMDALPWQLNKNSHINLEFPDKNGNMQQKVEGKGQCKTGPGWFTCNSLYIPHTVVDYKAGIPVLLRSYDVESGHIQLENAKKEKGKDYQLPYNEYVPSVIYTLSDTKFWSKYKNVKQACFIRHAIEEMISNLNVRNVKKDPNSYESKLAENTNQIFTLVKSDRVQKHVVMPG